MWQEKRLHSGAGFAGISGRIRQSQTWVLKDSRDLQARTVRFCRSRFGGLRASQLLMKKSGTVEALNVSPKGFYEGFLLKTGKRVVQINFPKEEHEPSARDLKPGQQVTIEVESEQPHGKPEHDVFRLVHLLSVDGRVVETIKQGTSRFSGRIEALNYALHGEVNGGILDSGDFLHVKPEGARALKMKAGMEVEGHGSTRPMVGGHSVIEAEEANGIGIRGHKASQKHAAKHARH
jgi:hypothetical protein